MNQVFRIIWNAQTQVWQAVAETSKGRGKTKSTKLALGAALLGLAGASFAELLYHFYRDDLRVVVAGTHGKSTTAGLLGHLMKGLDDSSFMVGAVLQNYESNFHKGDGHYIVLEGDEYKSEFDDPTPKFQYYKPSVS